MSKNRNLYIVPRIEVESIETASFIAGSIGIESGGSIGGGSHGISGAKVNTFLWDEEDILSENMEDDDRSYTYKAE